MGILQEFKSFAMRGNVVDLAVGLIIGVEFGKIVKSAVSDLIMPPIGKALGGVNFTDLKFSLGESGAAKALASAKEKLAEATSAGMDAASDGMIAANDAVTRATADVATYGETISINYGNFVQNIFNFVIIAFAVFMIVRVMNTMKKKEEAAPAAAPPKEEVLLTEIRDLLAKKN